jgi:hypothetical protein
VLAFASMGAAPFGDGHPAAVLYRVVQETPDLSLVDNELRGLVAACLAKDPTARPAMAEILDTFAGADASEDWLPQPVTTMISDVEIDGARFSDVDLSEGEISDVETPRTRKQRRGLSRFIPTRRRKTVDAPPTVSNPSAIERGWNGLAWGATVSQFQARFPSAAQENGEWWVTGQGPESFCGIVMPTQYAFNDRGQLCLVVFYPEAKDRERLPGAFLQTLGAPDGATTKWTRGDVVVDVKVASVAASITHLGFDAR